jgi:hypothetical protein
VTSVNRVEFALASANGTPARETVRQAARDGGSAGDRCDHGLADIGNFVTGGHTAGISDAGGALGPPWSRSTQRLRIGVKKFGVVVAKQGAQDYLHFDVGKVLTDTAVNTGAKSDQLRFGMGLLQNRSSEFAPAARTARPGDA